MRSWLINWLAYSIDWKVWAIGGLVIAAIAFRLLGWRWAIAIGAAIAGAVALNRQGQIGYEARIKQEKDAVDAQQEHWNQIDAKPLAPDAAYRELHSRADKLGK